MRKIITILLLISMTHYAAAQTATKDGYTSEGAKRVGTGLQQGSNAAIGLSMFGWGLALAAAIAIIAAAFHESDTESAH